MSKQALLLARRALSNKNASDKLIYEALAEINKALNKSDSGEEANARLIAAAPDLLKFCKTLAKRPGDYLCVEDWVSLLGVIEKATGEQV